MPNDQHAKLNFGIIMYQNVFCVFFKQQIRALRACTSACTFELVVTIWNLVVFEFFPATQSPVITSSAVSLLEIYNIVTIHMR